MVSGLSSKIFLWKPAAKWANCGRGGGVWGLPTGVTRGYLLHLLYQLSIGGGGCLSHSRCTFDFPQYVAIPFVRFHCSRPVPLTSSLSMGLSLSLSLSIYISAYLCIYIYMCIHIHDVYMHIYTHSCVLSCLVAFLDLHVYIYIYVSAQVAEGAGSSSFPRLKFRLKPSLTWILSQLRKSTYLKAQGT